MLRACFIDPAFGGVMPTIFAPELNATSSAHLKTEREKLDYHTKKYLAKIGVPVDAYWVLDHTELPSKVFRNAWIDIGRKVVVDMVQARIVHMDRIRVDRNKELDRIDKTPEYLVATRKAIRGNTTDWEIIDGVKQTFRDIPQIFKLSSYRTSEALHAAWPVELPRSFNVYPV